MITFDYPSKLALQQSVGKPLLYSGDDLDTPTVDLSESEIAGAVATEPVTVWVRDALIVMVE